MKANTLRKLEKALSEGLVDEEVIVLLHAINSIDDAVTTSSCSGRFQLIQVPDTGDKLGSNILGKWHRKVSAEEVLEALGKWDGTGQVHLLVQPLLVHIRCRDIATAAKLRTIAQENGLKFSTIRSVKLDRRGGTQEWGIMVEFLGTERMEVPIHGIARKLFQDIIPPLVRHGNGLIDRTKGHIEQLAQSLSSKDRFGDRE